MLGAPGVDEGRGLHHEPRRAVAALQAVVDRERPLDGVVEALRSDDLAFLQDGGGQQTTRLGRAAHHARAGAADSGAADGLGAGETEPVADDQVTTALGMAGAGEGPVLKAQVMALISTAHGLAELAVAGQFAHKGLGYEDIVDVLVAPHGG